MEAKVSTERTTLIRRVVEDIATAEQCLERAVQGLGQLAFNLRDLQDSVREFGNRILDIVGEAAPTPETVTLETAIQDSVVKQFAPKDAREA